MCGPVAGHAARHVARRDQRGEGPADRALVAVERLDVLDFDHGLLAGEQVADAGREHVRPLLLEQGAAVTGAHRVVVAPESLLALVDLTDELPPVDRHREAGDGSARGDRERVDGLDGLRLVVAVALPHDGAGVTGHHLGADLHAQQGDGPLDTAPREEPGPVVVALRRARFHRLRPPS